MSASMLKAESSFLRVPGARLYYEVQGSGPLLLLIPGGPTDAGIFAPLAGLLSDRYTVVSYDPRGNSRSVFDGPPVDQDMDVHGDDAAQLLAALTDQPAYVLGSSGGAQIGLNLAARHPGRVRKLVAHEPPCVQLLPDAEEQWVRIETVLQTYRTSGPGAAMLRFMDLNGLGDRPRTERAKTPPSPEVLESFQRVQANLDYFLAHGMAPLSSYVPDVSALREGPVTIVIGVGETSAGQTAGRSGIALAERLGIAPVEFPGGHGGYNDAPAAFAEKLRSLFSDAR